MFTGIIEELGKVVKIEEEGTNHHFFIQTSDTSEYYIDQSIAHNGVCLTIVELLDNNVYKVTAIKETLDRTNLGLLSVGNTVNIERGITGMTRMDGHIVQGHVDGQAKCISIIDEDGSWTFTFEVDSDDSVMIVDKGSVCINGVSLTVVSPTDTTFSVAIIPYTYEHTTFHSIQVGDNVNIEWDIIGKYVVRYMDRIQGRK